MNYEIITEDEQYVTIKFVNTKNFTNLKGRGRNDLITIKGIVYTSCSYPNYSGTGKDIIVYLPGTLESWDSVAIYIPWIYWVTIKNDLKNVLASINNEL